MAKQKELPRLHPNDLARLIEQHGQAWMQLLLEAIAMIDYIDGLPQTGTEDEKAQRRLRREMLAAMVAKCVQILPPGST